MPRSFSQLTHRVLRTALLAAGLTLAASDRLRAEILPWVLVPVTDAEGQPVRLPHEHGSMFPVARLASDLPLAGRIREILGTPAARELLELHRMARCLALADPSPSLSALELEGLREPAYLLLSQEEGGFGRIGLWLQAEDGSRRFTRAGYVELVVDERDLVDGSFEEIFFHELGHLTVLALTGRMPPGPSRKMHQSQTATDYPTAFDEGFAIHFQPVVRARSENPVLRARDLGEIPEDGVSAWLSRVDGRLRIDAVRRNHYVLAKRDPPHDPPADPFTEFLEAEAWPEFNPLELKSGQQMLATEGVAATIFHRLVHDRSLAGRYSAPSFYAPFLDEGVAVPDDPASRIPAFVNANLKLYAAMHELGKTRPGADRPWIAELVETYGRVFPEDREAVVDLFLRTTHGGTASREATALWPRLARAGLRGDMEGFIGALREQRLLLGRLRQEVLSGLTDLDAAVGPEIWLLNEDFRIGRAAWSPHRDIPLSVNLNTAGPAELRTIPGVDTLLADRILEGREARGWFDHLDELAAVEGVTPELLGRLRTLEARMQEVPGFIRD
jgi:hypothetical protein